MHGVYFGKMAPQGSSGPHLNPANRFKLGHSLGKCGITRSFPLVLNRSLVSLCQSITWILIPSAQHTLWRGDPSGCALFAFESFLQVPYAPQPVLRMCHKPPFFPPVNGYSFIFYFSKSKKRNMHQGLTNLSKFIHLPSPAHTSHHPENQAFPQQVENTGNQYKQQQVSESDMLILTF